MFEKPPEQFAALTYLGVMLLVGLAFPYQANSSLLKNVQETLIGPALIGQPFTSNRYFNSCPSTTSYSTADPKADDVGVLKTGVSGASNLPRSLIYTDEYAIYTRVVKWRCEYKKYNLANFVLVLNHVFVVPCSTDDWPTGWLCFKTLD